MSKVVVAAALLASLSISPLLHANQAEQEAQCRTWAQEDEVAPDQVADYVARCVEDLKASAAEDAKQGESDSGR